MKLFSKETCSRALDWQLHRFRRITDTRRGVFDGLRSRDERGDSDGVGLRLAINHEFLNDSDRNIALEAVIQGNTLAELSLEIVSGERRSARSRVSGVLEENSWVRDRALTDGVRW